MRAAIDKFRLVFLHPPKTGGTSLYTYFSALAGEHRWAGGNDLPKHLKTELTEEQWRDYTWVMTVREPFQRLVSAYKFFSRYHASGMEFDAFLALAVSDYQDRSVHWNLPQVRWLPDHKVPMIYKCEELSAKFPDMKKVMRPSKGPSWEELWTPKRQKIVSKHYSEDYERFDYAAPSPTSF